MFDSARASLRILGSRPHWSRLARRTVVVMAALVLAGCGSSPTGSSSPAASGTAAPTPSEIGGPPNGWCTVADLRLGHGLVEGAAGSRFTTLTLTVVADTGCAVRTNPAIELIDARGAVVVSGAQAGGRDPLELGPGETASTTVQLSSWCEVPAPEPLTLALILETGDLQAAGGSFPGGLGMPPCNGTATTLVGTPWSVP